MLTQLVLYGRKLKVNLGLPRCRIRAAYEMEGSALAGTIETRCLRLETIVEVESDAEPERIAAVLRNAEHGCHAQVTVQRAVPVTASFVVNGRPFDYGAHLRGTTKLG
jgi:hypothetical protein